MPVHSEYGFYYLPYTYGFRYPKWKNISDLGFRIKNFDKLLLNKDNYFFINLYGCSNAYSILNSDLDTFSYLLEVKLNKDENIRKKTGKEIKILNFSRPANILFDQQLNHIIYGSLFDPKIVLSHIGTDFTYSQIADTNLLKKYKLNYVEIHELWSKLLHESDHPINLDNCEEDSKNFMKAKIKNFENEIIDALFYRCNQFKKISETFGAHIIFGVTPFSISKKKTFSS